MKFEVETWKDSKGRWRVDYGAPPIFCCGDLYELFNWSEDKQSGFSIGAPTENPNDTNPGAVEAELLFRGNKSKEDVSFPIEKCPFCFEFFEIVDTRRVQIRATLLDRIRKRFRRGSYRTIAEKAERRYGD